MKIFGLLEVQYNEFKQSIINYLNSVLNKNKIGFGSSTIFGQIINVLSAAVQNIMLYIEDAFVEQNKYTAQRKKSIYGLASLSGYQPSLGKAAGVQIKFNYIPTNTQTLDVIIKNHEQFICTQNGLQYNLILPQENIILSIDKNVSSKYIYAVEGLFETQTFTSIGGKYYTQNVKFSGNMDPDYMEVYINNIKYEQVAGIYDMIPNGLQYTYKVNYLGGIDLIFGNDIYGKSLENGDVIRVTYLLHDGEEGNLTMNNNTYFVFNNNITNIAGEPVDGNSLFNVTFATNDAVTAGTNSESTEQVRQMIGLNSRALVLASADNYKCFLNKFSFVGYNRTWSERGSLIINSLIMKNYNLLLKDGKDYFNLTPDDFKLSDTQKKSLKNSIIKNGSQMAGTTYNILDPELNKYALYIYIKTKSVSFDEEYIKLQIKELIGEFFANIKSDIFIPKSDIIQLLKNNIDIIDSINVYFLSEKNETALQTKTYEKITTVYDPSLGTYHKNIEQVYLYDGENPNLGLDEHGNILLESNDTFPVLMGGWDYLNKENQEVDVVNPLNIFIN